MENVLRRKRLRKSGQLAQAAGAVLDVDEDRLIAPVIEVVICVRFKLFKRWALVFGLWFSWEHMVCTDGPMLGALVCFHH